jgi:hypothetical protein
VGREPGTRPGTTRVSAIGKQTQARERAARLRAEKGSTAAGGGTLEISGGDVAGKAGEMQEAQRRAGAPDVDTSQFQVPEMEEALRSMMPRVWDRLQQARKAGKFAEQDYEHYLRELLLRAYEARKMPKPEMEPRVIGAESGRTWIRDDPKTQLPPQVEELGRKLGVTHFFLGAEAEKDPFMGQNISHRWYNRVVDTWQTSGTPRAEAEARADLYVREILDDVKGLTQVEKDNVLRSVKTGGSAIFLDPRVRGRGTGVHEVMHTLTHEELKEDIGGSPVSKDEIQNLLDDVKDKAVHDVGGMTTRFPDYFRKRTEYFTELMAQYFMKNLKEGSRSEQLAEAILRTSNNETVRNLVGASLGAVIAFHLAKKLQAKGD